MGQALKVFVGFGVATIVFAGCSSSEKSTDGSKVEAFAATSPKAGTSTTFGALIPGSWEKGAVSCPDVPESAVRSALGVNWPKSGDYLPVADGQQIVVVVKGNEVVSADTSSRKSVDLCGQSGYPRSVTPQTKVTLSEQKWTDGTTYLQGSF